MVGKVTYSWEPNDWNQKRFLSLGGFTVVFLNYNKAQFIEKSVAAALAQDFPLCEMFFMDDASSDGSGDTMEKLVREYRGRHKVTVVRNTENQHITGQWNIVSRLATGNWFGMFCGDDYAREDRVSVVAGRIRECPSLRGLCTQIQHVYILQDPERDVPPSQKELNYQVLQDDLYPLFAQQPPILGATAWWHRSLFDESLPRGPLDDLVLRAVLQLKCREMSDPVWLWDGVDTTVDYNVGDGITSQCNLSNVSAMEPSARWVGRVMAYRHFCEVAEKTWRGVLEYYTRCHAPAEYLLCARCAITYYQSGRSNTFGRVFLMPKVLLYICSSHSDERILRRLWKSFWKHFIQEFFGLRFAAFVSHRVLKRI